MATLPLGRERHFEESEDNAECKLKIGNIFCESRAPLSTIVSPPNILFKDSPFEASAPTKGCHQKSEYFSSWIFQGFSVDPNSRSNVANTSVLEIDGFG